MLLLFYNGYVSTWVETRNEEHIVIVIYSCMNACVLYRYTRAMLPSPCVVCCKL
jgi:hypothetical protein